jgi:two-component system, cell cycle sensor histidine kinase and response regulator CckA
VSAGRGRDIRLWLLAIVLAVGVPLVTVQAVLLVAIHAEAREREEEDLRALARLVALRLEDLLGELGTVIAVARPAIRPEVRFAYPNDTALSAIAVNLPPYVTSLSVYDPDGVNMGHSVRFDSDSARRILRVRDRRYFQSALARDGLNVGAPVVGRLTREFTVGAARAFRGPDGAVQSVHATTTVTTRIRELLLVPGLSGGAQARLVDSSGALVASTDLVVDSLLRGMPAPPVDSEQMLVARANVRGAPWEVIVETPADAALAPVWARLTEFIVIAAVVLLLAGILALVLAQRIVRPLLALGASTKALTRSPDIQASVVASGPDVVRELAADFNEMALLVSRRTAELARSERQLRLVTDGVPMLIGLVDLAGRVRFLNQPGEVFVGRSLGDAVGKPLLELLGAGAEASLGAPLQEALGGKTAETELQLRRADGHLADVTCSCVPHRGASGGVDGAFVLITDVTSGRRLEAQLRQAQRMDAIGRLAGGIAHDFNNLLTVIIANLEFSLETARTIPGAESIHADLRAAREASERAASLTKQLLAYSRQQAGQREAVDLNAIASAGERMLRRLIGERIEVRINLAPDLGAVRADASQLEQVLVNLVVNARDAMPSGGTLTIETSSVELDETYAASHAQVAPGEYVSLEVTDTGTGIAPDVLPMIFEPFFTTKGVGEGTGLGLAVCYGIVQQHGGAISAYSRLGEGTTFKVLLPRTSEHASGPSRVPAAEPRRGTETVLLVEDDDAVRSTARRALEERGYHVLLAANGQDALALVSAPHPPIDLLVTDYVMPGLSGVELAADLRLRLPGLRVLLVSGYARTGSRSASGIPVDMPYLAKPYTGRSLAAKVREVLDAPAG